MLSFFNNKIVWLATFGARKDRFHQIFQKTKKTATTVHTKTTTETHIKRATHKFIITQMKNINNNDNIYDSDNISAEKNHFQISALKY